MNREADISAITQILLAEGHALIESMKHQQALGYAALPFHPLRYWHARAEFKRLSASHQSVLDEVNALLNAMWCES